MFDKTTGETYIGETKIRDHNIRVVLLQNQPPAWKLQQMLAAVHAEVHGLNMTGGLGVCMRACISVWGGVTHLAAAQNVLWLQE